MFYIVVIVDIINIKIIINTIVVVVFFMEICFLWWNKTGIFFKLWPHQYYCSTALTEYLQNTRRVSSCLEHTLKADPFKIAAVQPCNPISQTFKDEQDMLGTAGKVRTNSQATFFYGLRHIDIRAGVLDHCLEVSSNSIHPIAFNFGLISLGKLSTPS